jgi:hypothetical protein
MVMAVIPPFWLAGLSRSIDINWGLVTDFAISRLKQGVYGWDFGYRLP